MFSTEHFIWIGICIVFIVALTYASLRFQFSFRTAAFIMAGISLASELSKILSHMESAADGGAVIEATALPFHLCSILIFAFFYLPFAKNEKLKKYLLNLTIPVAFVGASLAILMATSGVNFAKPEPYQCFLYHAGMIWFAIYLICTKQVDLGKKAWLINLASLFVLAIIMIWVNGLLQVYDTNFMYVVRPPKDNLPLLNLNNGWYAYFAILVACGFVGVTLVHLPSLIKEFLRERKAKKEENIAQ